MHKPSSAKKKPASPNASDAKKSPGRGMRANRDASSANAPEKEASASKKVSKRSASRDARLKNSSAASGAAAPQELSTSLLLAPAPGPRISIGTALCQVGVDERAVARGFAQVLGSLSPDNVVSDKGGDKKLLVDVLKECSRQLDNSAGNRAGDAPVVVQLLHTVSRPVRPAPALLSANPAPAIEIASQPSADPAVAVETKNPSTEPS
jgi:hypothetical protein